MYWRINYKLETYKRHRHKNVSFISVFCFDFFLWPESRPFIAQNITQISESYKCTALFSLIYGSIFIAPVRLIIIMLSFAHKLDSLWPESCPIITQDLAQMSDPKKCLSHLSFKFYRSCQADYHHAQYRLLWPESNFLYGYNEILWKVFAFVFPEKDRN